MRYIITAIYKLCATLWRQCKHQPTSMKQTLCNLCEALFTILRKIKREATPLIKDNASYFTFYFAPTLKDFPVYRDKNSNKMYVCKLEN